MDLGYLKLRIDTKVEYEEFKKKYEYKRKELKQAEVKQIFKDFKAFFKEDGNFKFKENDHSITAFYKDYGVTLDMDIYKNVASEDFILQGCIKTYEKETFEFIADGACNKEILQPAHIDKQEKMIHEIRYFKDFLNGEIFYTFSYKIAGREEAYNSMLELLAAL